MGGGGGGVGDGEALILVVRLFRTSKELPGRTVTRDVTVYTSGTFSSSK